MKKFTKLQQEPQNESLKSAIASGLAGLSMLVSSCQSISPEEKAKLQQEIEVLNKQEAKGKELVNYYDYQSKSKQEDISKLDQQVKDLETKLGILKAGKTPRFIIKLHVQEHKFEISVDRIDFDMEIPVDEQFYNECTIGKKLGEGSRSFSLGHDVDVKVIEKRIE